MGLWPSPAARQDDKDTGVGDSCERCGSAADALNALAVLQEWLQESPLVFI